jgi:hypothetical protein
VKKRHLIREAECFPWAPPKREWLLLKLG